MLNFKIKCGCCGNIEQNKFQVTMEDDDGYSNYTVVDTGYLEIKCIKCGAFGSEDYNKKDMGNNKIDQFEITCNNCGSKKNTYYPGDCYREDFPEGGYLECDECKVKERE